MSDGAMVVLCETESGPKFYAGYQSNGLGDSGVVLRKSVRPCTRFSEETARMAHKQLVYLGWRAMLVSEKDAKRAYRKRGVGA
tara:strand:+ start:466 stop:714 length:249 start_codon:yes stop_codon:yes gene_type:complete